MGSSFAADPPEVSPVTSNAQPGGPVPGRVSIVTPCLNPGGWIVRCLDSVAAQTYPDVEHVVVDGGSTDGTVELLRDRGVRFISEPDSGQSEAINKGFALASGAYLGWLNADDVLTPGSVSWAVEGFRADGLVGWVYGDCEVRESDGSSKLERPPSRLHAASFDLGNRLAGPGMLIARWALDRVGVVDETLQLAMDFDLWLRLQDAGVASAYVPETLAVFEVHEASKTGMLNYSEFFREESTVLLKSGRRSSAAALLGRAAAAAAQTENGTVDSSRLRELVAGFESQALALGLAAELRLVEPAAYAEAARLELQASVKGVRHLMRPGPWRFALTRRLLGGAARRTSSRALHRATRHLGIGGSKL